MNILLIEDELKIAEYINKALVETGHTVTEIHSGDVAMVEATTNPYDIILLDLGLPVRSGLEILGAIRERSIATPVLILTALGDVTDRIAGLEKGADDYLTKPFAMEELLARIQALTRRKGADASPLLRTDDLVINETTRTVARAGRPISLSGREFEVLTFLMKHAGRPVTRTDLCEHVWKSALDDETNVVDVYIQRLREKVDQHSEVKLIQTVRGTGYMLGAPKE